MNRIAIKTRFKAGTFLNGWLLKTDIFRVGSSRRFAAESVCHECGIETVYYTDYMKTHKVCSLCRKLGCFVKEAKTWTHPPAKALRNFPIKVQIQLMRINFHDGVIAEVLDISEDTVDRIARA